MKESIGYTVSLNLMIVFITVIVAFLCAALIYFKSNKVSNLITSSIEKYEGYNTSAVNEIKINLSSLGYGSKPISCSNSVDDKTDSDGVCTLVGDSHGRGINGYCVYLCVENSEYYFYKIRTNMMFSIPIIHDVLDIPIYSNTNRLYDFN
jgi:hypothetical protein